MYFLVDIGIFYCYVSWAEGNLWDFMRHCKGILHCETSQARGDLPQNSCSLPCTESWQLRVGLLTSLDQGYRFTWDLRCISKYKFVQAKELPGWTIKNPIWLGDIGGKLWFGVPKMPNKIIGCQPVFFFVASCPATFARRSLTMRIVVSDLSDMRCWCMCDWEQPPKAWNWWGAFLSLVTLPRADNSKHRPSNHPEGTSKRMITSSRHMIICWFLTVSFYNRIKMRRML